MTGRLCCQDVEPGARNPPFLQRLDERRLVHSRTAPGIDEDRVLRRKLVRAQAARAQSPCALALAWAQEGSQANQCGWLGASKDMVFVARRRSTFPRVKFLSRGLTALNLLPSIATLAVASRPTWRHRSTNLHAELLDR